MNIIEALHAAKSKLETIISVSPLAIFLLDLKGNVQLWNPAAENIFGWRADEVLDKPNPIVSASIQDEHVRLNAQVLSGTAVTNQETVQQCKDGSLIDVSISSAPIYDSSGNLIGRMAIVADITERKHRERELQAIATLSAALRVAPTRAEMLPAIVNQIVSLFNSDAATIEIIDPQTGDAVVEAAQGIWEGLIGSRQKKGTGVNAIISQTLQPFYSRDLESD